MIELPTYFGAEGRRREENLQYVVIDVPSRYNAILGLPALNRINALISTAAMRFQFDLPGCPAEYGVVTAEPEIATIGSALSTEKLTMTHDELDVRAEVPRQVEPHSETEEVPLFKRADRMVKVSKGLNKHEKELLIAVLESYICAFAWTAEDMPGVDPSFVTHTLDVDPNAKPIRQKKRSMGWEKQAAAKVETKKLLDAGFIREVQYPEWLANVVVVRKKEGKWRMCVDFTDLNKHCPKDSYPLPKIDMLVDSAAGHKYLTFMDAYSGYHQIHLAAEDQEKTAFITDEGTFCYVCMPFGLKNAGARYQKAMNKMFAEQRGRNMEIYVDDILVKSRTLEEHLADLRETFEVLNKHKMKLNPAKCAFGVKAPSVRPLPHGRRT